MTKHEVTGELKLFILDGLLSYCRPYSKMHRLILSASFLFCFVSSFSVLFFEGPGYEYFSIVNAFICPVFSSIASIDINCLID